MFKSCEICGADKWDLIVYEGAMRSGSFGTCTEGGRILRCGGCGADRLDEKVSIAGASVVSYPDQGSFRCGYDHDCRYTLQYAVPKASRIRELQRSEDFQTFYQGKGESKN